MLFRSRVGRLQLSWFPRRPVRLEAEDLAPARRAEYFIVESLNGGERAGTQGHEAAQIIKGLTEKLEAATGKAWRMP